MNHLRTLTILLLAGACSSPEHRAAPGSLESPESPESMERVSLTQESWMQLEDMQGRSHDLSQALAGGRSVALVFWQSWCAACIREAPKLAAASERLEGELDFYGVVSGPDEVVDEQAVNDMARRLQLPYPQVRDRSGELARRFEVVGTPTIVVIEPSGRVSYSGHEPPPSWGARADAGR